MSNQKAIVCQRCGRGFVSTTSYQEFLTRRGVKVKTPALCMACFIKAGPLPKQRGQVKWFDQRKQYGFITTQEGEEIFFHHQQLLGDQEIEPHEGQTAIFHTRQALKGPEALNVELVQKQEQSQVQGG